MKGRKKNCGGKRRKWGVGVAIFLLSWKLPQPKTNV